MLISTVEQHSGGSSMGRNRVAHLVVLSWTFLLLCLVQGWKHIDEKELQEILQGQYSLAPVATDDRAELNIHFDDDEEDEDDLFYDSEGEATEDDLDPEPEFHVPPVRTIPTPDPDPGSTGYDFKCTKNAFINFMSKKKLDKVQVIGPKDLLLPNEASESCGYKMNHEEGTLTVPFSGCYVRNEKSGYSLQLLFAEESQVRTAYCEDPKVGKTGLSPRAGSVPENPRNCPFGTPDPPTRRPPLDPPKPEVPLPGEHRTRKPLPTPYNCDIPTDEQVPCDHPGKSLTQCKMMGCCVNPSTLACFYPVDECTEDRHFVFAIRHDSASIPLDPKKLIIPGSSCRPVIVTDTVAVFKFKVTECGARSFNVAETQIYLAEVQTPAESLNLKYGVISRSTQVRFLVECRYSLSAQRSLASVGYMVKTPSSIMPSAVRSDGLYGVELRIAEDETYSNFYPTYHKPLRLLLGKPVYLQLRLLSPTPEAVILVNYCIAYPRSGTNALVLVYEGCANPNDPNTSVLLNSEFTADKNERYFMVKAFQFMDQNTNQYLDEEIYFMCSTEVCFPAERTCQERCFDG